MNRDAITELVQQKLEETENCYMRKDSIEVILEEAGFFELLEAAQKIDYELSFGNRNHKAEVKLNQVIRKVRGEGIVKENLTSEVQDENDCETCGRGVGEFCEFDGEEAVLCRSEGYKHWIPKGVV